MLHIHFIQHWFSLADLACEESLDKHPLPDLLHGNEQRVYGDSAYASQNDLINSKAAKAKDSTNHRSRRNGVINEDTRSQNRNKSRTWSRVEHVFRVVKRLWGFGKVRFRGLKKNATRASPCGRGPTSTSAEKG